MYTTPYEEGFLDGYNGYSHVGDLYLRDRDYYYYDQGYYDGFKSYYYYYYHNP